MNVIAGKPFVAWMRQLALKDCCHSTYGVLSNSGQRKRLPIRLQGPWSDTRLDAGYGKVKQ